MSIKSWWTRVRQRLPFRRTKTSAPTDEQLRRIREKLSGKKEHRPARVNPLRTWPGFEMRKNLSAFEFLEQLTNHATGLPPKENRAAWKTIYEARLEILRDKKLTKNQLLMGMSRHDKEVAHQAIVFGKEDVFRACVASQIVHARKRIKEFSD